MTIRVRALSDEEMRGLAHMARSRTLGAGLVRRAQIVQHAVADGLSAPEVAAKMGLCGATVRFWLKRFNARGVSGLEEDMHSGRPATYTAEERSAVITAALSRPADLGLPFASWTLDRLRGQWNNQRPLITGQATRATQLAAAVAATVLIRPHQHHSACQATDERATTLAKRPRCSRIGIQQKVDEEKFIKSSRMSRSKRTKRPKTKNKEDYETILALALAFSSAMAWDVPEQIQILCQPSAMN